MKIALYIEDGLEQIVLTPESDTEKGILGKLHDGSRELGIHKGAFFNCRGGWTRYTPFQTHFDYGYTASDGDESTMIVLRPAQAIEARRAATGNTDAVADESAVPEGNAP
jgi:hypothetical protein